MEILQYEELVIDQDNKLCSIKGKPIALSKQEYELLVFLFLNPNKVFSREELLERIWKKDLSSRVVDVAVSRLRKKLLEYGKCITTRVGYGYSYGRI